MSGHLPVSERALRTGAQPISYYMQQAVENPNLISLAAGLVDEASFPSAAFQEAIEALLRSPEAAQAALQYGTTQGYLALREKLLARSAALDSLSPRDLSLTVDDVVVTTGSQQLLYLLAEALLDPGDIVITEAPSYFVFQGALTSLGARTLSVPMDEDGMCVSALAELLARLERTGELSRVKLIYVIDYFQNPTGLTLSEARRHELLDLVRKYSHKQRILILEDAAYRELRYDGTDVPSIKSFDHDNRHVILTMTFSKPLSPGLKTGYGVMPRDLVPHILHFKGNHDFGSNNLTQHLLHRLLENGTFDRHVVELCTVYRQKRDALLQALAEEFPPETGVRWTHPRGGLYVWLSFPQGVQTGPRSTLIRSAMEEGVLYVPGEFCFVNGASGPVPTNQVRLSFGVASCEQLREAVRRLGRAASLCLPTARVRV